MTNLTLSPTVALRIQELRAGPVMHSWRRIAEIICSEYPEAEQNLSGNQLYGEALCRKAAAVLGVSQDAYERDWL